MSHDFLDCLRDWARERRDRPEGRRRAARIPALGSFCTEISGELERCSIVSDLSATGLRLHRPYRGGHSEMVQLEFDLPGTDEVIWAKGVVCFDSIWQSDGQLLHTTGVELVAAASRHLRMLRDYSMDHAPRQYSERRLRSVAG
jgi:hypothetical protein